MASKWRNGGVAYQSKSETAISKNINETHHNQRIVAA